MQERRASLARLIESEILPRLLLSARIAPPVQKPQDPGPQEVAEFVQLLLGEDQLAAAAFVQGVRRRGVKPEYISLRLLAPAARLLGELWENNHCSLKQLNGGLARVMSMLRNLGNGSH